ncbi:MAG: hypothetical protein HUJ78_02110 [Mogibacterium sp.]|nr:hypothetical protein [Mogibacterium sp.]MCF0258270.1 hypothetical protein [Erysipelotrichaceae bacterium]
MTIKQDIEKDLHKIEDRIEDCEIRHDAKTIVREEQDIQKEAEKILKHENDIAEAELEGKTGFFADMDKKLKTAEENHDAKVIVHKTEVIENEVDKIAAHAEKLTD